MARQGPSPALVPFGVREKGGDKHGHPGDDPDAAAEYVMTLLMRAGKLGDAETVFELLRAGMQGLHTSAYSNPAS